MRELFNFTSGECQVRRSDGTDSVGTYRMGTVLTGRTQVFEGYRVELTVDSKIFTGHDSHSILKALLRVSATVYAEGYSLLVAGTSEAFYETGLSFNSNYGYLKNVDGQMHLMAPVPI